MVTVRTWLTRERQGPPVDRVFDAACDLMLAARGLETEVRERPADPPPAIAILGVLEATLRTLQGATRELGAGHPEPEMDAIARLGDALLRAADECERARATLLAAPPTR
ncbi:hypothetical protein AB0L40_03155 [Patulibacter sp. NPDC049589]|uniref:hypothetical protein n=1 Tax=Patulibacter sp. NPDC049589 TaxID=3154731 RepID=UPI0034132A59